MRGCAGSGASVDWGEPVLLSLEELIELCRERGRLVGPARSGGSVAHVLTCRSEAGSPASWQLRLARRVARHLPPGLLSALARFGARPLELALEAAFWSGVRSAATRARAGSPDP